MNKLWEIVKDREAWSTAIHGVTKNWTQLSPEQQQQGPGSQSRYKHDSIIKLFTALKPPTNGRC